MADKALKDSDRRTLIALGYYANRAGVCWPSIRTLAEDTGLAPNTLQAAIGRLLKAGYVRRLKPNDYDQQEGSWGYSNRYQILWRPNAPLPSFEQIIEANCLQPKTEQIKLDTEVSGVRGANDEFHLLMRQLAAAWAAAIEKTVGVRPAQVPPISMLTRLAGKTSPAELAAATEDLCRQRIKAGQNIPSLGMVADYIDCSSGTDAN